MNSKSYYINILFKIHVLMIDIPITVRNHLLIIDMKYLIVILIMLTVA